MALNFRLKGHLRSLKSLFQISHPHQKRIITLVQILNQLHQVLWGKFSGLCPSHWSRIVSASLRHQPGPRLGNQPIGAGIDGIQNRQLTRKSNCFPSISRLGCDPILRIC
jgi:hypothetical protein